MPKMPYKPKHPCAYPLCPNLVESGQRYCDKHKQTNTDNQSKRSSCAEGYDRKWQKVRAYKLRLNPLCEKCLAKGIVRVATQVHHKKKFKDNPELRLDIDILESLCKPCHDEETAKERREKIIG